MACTSPVTIQDKTTGGMMSVPCGRCISCRLDTAREWAIRITHERLFHEKACFATLTYSDEHIPQNKSLVKKHLQDFLKRFRRMMEPQKIRYFASGEYGEHTKRPHYHLCIFGADTSDEGTLTDAWKFGFVQTGNLSYDRAAYAAKYTIKKLNGAAAIEYKKRGVIPEFALMSRKPGLGFNWIYENIKYARDNGYVVLNGRKMVMPRFYTDKAFTDDEKGIRSVLKQKFMDDRLTKICNDVRLKYGYQALDYKKLQDKQRDVDVKSRLALKRRKL